MAGWTRRVTVGATVAGLATVWLGVSGTLGGFSSATVSNPTSNAGSAQLSVSHSYGTTCSAGLQATATTTSCPGSLYPATSTTGGQTKTDAITNTGTTTVTNGSYRVVGCGPVNLANSGSAKSAGDMLPRTGTTFNPTTGPFSGAGSITLDGTSGYASAVGSTSEPTGPAVIGNAAYGMGIWFKAPASATPSALFGFGSNALDTTAINDRILSLTATGAVSFVASPGGAAMTSSTTYRDDTWHYAYVLLSTSRLVVGLSYSVTLSVDGTTVATGNSGLLGSLSSYPGYWHLGWSPVAGTGRYFAGSLSGFVVDDSGNASAPASKPTAYSGGTEQWRLDDSGGASDGSTVTGVLPAATTLPTLAAEPCTVVTIAWPLVSTTSTLRALVTAGAKAAAAPAPGATQSSAITLTTSATAPAFDKGLILYAPIRADYTAGASTSWVVAFLWSTRAVTGTVVIG